MVSAAADDRRKAFSVDTSSDTHDFPYMKLQVAPSPEDFITAVHVDGKLGREALTYTFDAGREGTDDLNRVLNHDRDPGYLADLLLYKLTLEAEKRLEASGSGIRHFARRLEAYPPQVYRLLNTTNYQKSVRQMLALLHALDREVESRSVASRRLARSIPFPANDVAPIRLPRLAAPFVGGRLIAIEAAAEEENRIKCKKRHSDDSRPTRVLPRVVPRRSERPQRRTLI